MNHKIFLLVGALLLASIQAHATFDWGEGSGECSGSGTFQQLVAKGDVVLVGDIPVGKRDIYIELRSDDDVDIQIYDTASGDPIVGWNIGAPIGDYPNDNLEYDYAGVHIEYSGYNGDGTGYGHEFIRMTGALDRELTMKAYGYRSGYATVNYSWGGTDDCSGGNGPSDSGSGTFQQQISTDDVVDVGELIPGLTNVYIELISDRDVDIQLYDENEKIVQWPDGILDGSGRQTASYHGMEIEWSGYNGDGTGKGREYIKISGDIDRVLTMKAYGYQSGYAKVNYIWSKLPIKYQGGSAFYDFPNDDDVIVERATSDILNPGASSGACQGNPPGNQYSDVNFEGVATFQIWTRENSCDRVKLGSARNDFSEGRYIWNVYIPKMGIGDQASVGAFIYMDDQHEIDFECGYGKDATRRGEKINSHHEHIGNLPNGSEILCFMTSQGNPYSTTTISIAHSAWYKFEIELVENAVADASSGYTVNWFINGKLVNKRVLYYDSGAVNSNGGKFRIYSSVENLGFIGDHAPTQKSEAYFDFMEYLPSR